MVVVVVVVVDAAEAAAMEDTLESGGRRVVAAVRVVAVDCAREWPKGLAPVSAVAVDLARECPNPRGFGAAADGGGPTRDVGRDVPGASLRLVADACGGGG